MTHYPVGGGEQPVTRTRVGLAGIVGEPGPVVADVGNDVDAGNAISARVASGACTAGGDGSLREDSAAPSEGRQTSTDGS